MAYSQDYTYSGDSGGGSDPNQVQAPTFDRNYAGGSSSFNEMTPGGSTAPVTSPTPPQTSARPQQTGYTGGADPQQFLAYLNANPGADVAGLVGGMGGAAKYYAPGEHGAGEGAYVGYSNGYLAQTPQGWQWFTRGPETGGGGGAGGNSYGDPAYQLLNQLAMQRINSLGQPQSFPQFDAYMQQLQQQQAAAKQRAQTFADQLGTRIGQLQQPLMGDKEHALVQSQAMNNLFTQRDAAQRQMMDRVSASGFMPSSGLVEGNTRSINEQFGNQQADIQAKLAMNEIGANEQRRNQATQLQGLVQQALAGGDLTALQNQAQQADIENQMYNLNQQRAREQLTTANVPVDLENMGLANAMGVIGGNQNSGLSQLMPLLNAQMQQQQFGNQNYQNQLSGWGGIYSMLSNLFNR